MNYLSLFTGAGGGDLGMQHLLGFRCRGYVEYEPYCQEVIKARIKDGLLDAAPIFGDIRAFVSEGYAESYQGMVELITGGFPCQPFSYAGKRGGQNDPRNMWPSTYECLSIIKPRYGFFENVPGLLGSSNPDIEWWDLDEAPTDNLRYFGTILRDISKAGYWFNYRTLGTRHLFGKQGLKRDRIWILALRDSLDVERLWIQKRVSLKDKLWSTAAPPNILDVEESWLVANDWGRREPYGVSECMDRFKAIGNAQDGRVAATAFRILSGGLT